MSDPKRLRLVAGWVAVGLAMLIAAVPVFAQPAPRKDAVLRGDAQCTRCHDETDDYPVYNIGRTRHGTVADGRNPTCTTCHGASETHVRKPEGVVKRPKPDRFFRHSSTPAAERNAACLACHQGGKRIHWQGSAHEAGDIACTSCHQIHTANDPVRDKLRQPEVCFACHKEQRNLVNRASRHPTLEGKVACSDCHNPHGSAGPKLMVRDTVNDTCFQCHMQFRGPFVRTHQPVAEDCAICHNPHGSNHPALLKQRPPWLCQQCHEPTGHRGNLANVTAPGNTVAQVAVGRGCVNCHTNVHGTNNPRDAANQRTYRR